MSHSFSLPLHLAVFDVPTLFVVMDHELVKYFLIENNTMSLISEAHSPIKDIHRSDKDEGRQGNGHSGHSGGHENHDREYYECVFCKQVAEEINHMYNGHKFERAVLYVPKDLRQMVTKHLDHRAQERMEEYTGIITHENALEMITHVVEHRNLI